MSVNRRRYLEVIGTAVTASAASIAGCGSPGAGGDESPVEGTEPETTDPPGTIGGETEDGLAATEAEPGTETAAGETIAGGPAETTAGTATGTATDVTDEISMVTDGSEYYFDPVGLYVEPGETITWTIQSGSHTSTAYAETLDAANTTRIPEGAEAWNSGYLSQEGAEFTHTFETTGTYDYFCIPHKQLGMVGRLVVGEPGGPAEEGQSPHGELPAPERIVEEKVIGWDEFDAE